MLPQFRTVMEVGCAVGTNLRMIREAFPWTECSGSDLNAGAIAYARAKQPTVLFRVADALADSATWAPRSIDLVISCYTLAYVAPHDVATVLRRAVRAAKVGLVLTEPVGDGPGLVNGLSFPEWRHSYLHLLTEALKADGRQAMVKPERLRQPVDRCDALYTVQFTGDRRGH